MTRVAFSGQLWGRVKKVCLVLDDSEGVECGPSFESVDVEDGQRLGAIWMEEYGKDDPNSARRYRGRRRISTGGK